MPRYRRHGDDANYVSRQRLLAILDRGYELLLHRLAAWRAVNSRFLAFPDTVAKRNYRDDNEQVGWVGVRFQMEAGSPP